MAFHILMGHVVFPKETTKDICNVIFINQWIIKYQVIPK